MSKVSYRDVAGFPGYRVGDDGSVWSRRKRGWGPDRLYEEWIRLTLGRATGGRLKVNLGRKHSRLVHLLVLEAFVGRCPSGQQCRHLDGDHTNNRLTNLQWGTRAENDADRQAHGATPKGERCGTAKLTDAAVQAIRQAAAAGTTRAALATKYGVSWTTINRVVSRCNWRHVSDS